MSNPRRSTCLTCGGPAFKDAYDQWGHVEKDDYGHRVVLREWSEEELEELKKLSRNAHFRWASALEVSRLLSDLLKQTPPTAPGGVHLMDAAQSARFALDRFAASAKSASAAARDYEENYHE